MIPVGVRKIITEISSVLVGPGSMIAVGNMMPVGVSRILVKVSSVSVGP